MKKLADKHNDKDAIFGLIWGLMYQNTVSSMQRIATGYLATESWEVGHTIWMNSLSSVAATASCYANLSEKCNAA
jgi:hypothetical protein